MTGDHPPLVSNTVSVYTGEDESHASQKDTSQGKEANSLGSNQIARRRRYELQRVAAQLLRSIKHPAGKDWRTIRCLQAPSGAVAIRYTPQIKRASFVGCCVCGSVWVCPVCSARISELRRVEIAAAHGVHAAAGGSALLVTLTVPHAISDHLSALLGTRKGTARTGIAGAVQRFRISRSYKSITHALGLVGLVRATEITRGSSGWHPHLHELWFVCAEQDDRQRINAQHHLARVWQESALQSGLGEPSLDRGVDLRWAWDASAYLSKVGHERASWGPENEIASAIRKRGRRGSLGPWELLRLAGDGGRAATDAWTEFAIATYRNRQLVWTRGLKAALSIEERSDEQLARHVDEESFLLAVIPPERWRVVLSLEWEARGQLLELAEQGGPDLVSDFIDLAEVDPARARDFARITLERSA